ncbi:MAG: hemerythrin domain-containing protein [Polyangiaceae bacterium]
MSHPDAYTPSLRTRFLGDHDRLEVLFEELLRAFEDNDREAVARLWNEFDSGLQAHFAAEEAVLFPAMETHHPHETMELKEEHDAFRQKLTELGIGVDLHLVKLDDARAFIRSLRQHARREDHLLYPWGTEHLRAAKKEAALRRLERPRHVSPPAM